MGENLKEIPYLNYKHDDDASMKNKEDMKIQTIINKIKEKDILRDQPGNQILEDPQSNSLEGSILNKVKKNLLYLKEAYFHNDIIKNIFKERIEYKEKKVDELQNKYNNKKRHYEINTYYNKKLSHQTNLLKNVSFVFLIMMVFCLLFKMNLITENIFIILIGISIALVIIYICMVTIEIIFKDNKYYDEKNIPFRKNKIKMKTKIKSNNLWLLKDNEEEDENCNDTDNEQ